MIYSGSSPYGRRSIFCFLLLSFTLGLTTATTAEDQQFNTHIKLSIYKGLGLSPLKRSPTPPMLRADKVKAKKTISALLLAVQNSCKERRCT